MIAAAVVSTARIFAAQRSGRDQLARQPTAQARLVTIPARYSTGNGPVTETTAMKLSAVNRCVEVLSDSMSKLPYFLMDTNTREHLTDDDVLQLLTIRPNEAMTPSIHKKMLEINRITMGNGYDWIVRDPVTGRPAELIPVPGELVNPWQDTAGHVWYDVTNPLTGALMRLSGEDVRHFKAFSHDGLKGVSYLQRASEIIAAGSAAQAYSKGFYQGDANPTGVLTVDGDLNKKTSTTLADGTVVTTTQKDLIRDEWSKYHGAGSHRIAILDYGLKYQAISTTPADAQFVETSDLSIQDFARVFGVPLYKLQSGKQSYNSNEQNAIEYVTGTLHPIVTQYEEESSWKLLTDSQLRAGREYRINMMAELKGDTASRGTWYRNMREIGGFSVNDILRLEDMPDVDGGDSRYASWNYGPLNRWEQLSAARNGGNGK